jgi:UDP-glucose 4-epimerase
MANNNGNCCVLGGAGFIGKALVAQLCRSGRTVQVVGRGPVPENLPIGATYLSANLRDPASLRGLFVSAAEVIDLVYGSVPKTSFEDPFADIQNNLPATLAVMEELARSQVERFIYVSSGGTVYGEASSLPISEEHPTRPISPYGVSKLASERYADLYRVCRDVPTIIARPGNAYGEHQAGNVGQGFIATAMWRCLRRQPVTMFGERGSTRDYIHVDDIANALLALLDKGLVGDTYNIGTGIGTDNRQIIDFVTSMAEHSGIAAPQVEIKPSRPFDVKANVLDVKKLDSVTGWRPSIDLREGIQRCWNHMLDIHIKRDPNSCQN